MLFLNWQLAVVALLVFPITLIGPRILTPKAVQANYEQKLNEFVAARHGAGERRGAGGDQGVQPAAPHVRLVHVRNNQVRDKTASAVFLSTMVERSVTISVLLLHLVVLAIGAYLATKGQITVGTFVTFESAFWEVSYNIAHLMHFIPVSIYRRQRCVTSRNCSTSRPAAPIGRRARPAAHHQRHHLRPRHVQIRRRRDAGARQSQSQAQCRQDHCDRRTQRLRQEHAPESDPSLLRAGRGALDHRRRRIRKVTRESLRGSMAVVFQENMLFNMSIRENIRLGKEGATDQEVEEAARRPKSTATS